MPSLGPRVVVHREFFLLPFFDDSNSAAQQRTNDAGIAPLSAVSKRPAADSLGMG
jgi:hypothetical protein